MVFNRRFASFSAFCRTSANATGAPFLFLLSSAASINVTSSSVSSACTGGLPVSKTVRSVSVILHTRQRSQHSVAVFTISGSAIQMLTGACSSKSALSVHRSICLPQYQYRPNERALPPAARSHNGIQHFHPVNSIPEKVGMCFFYHAGSVVSAPTTLPIFPLPHPEL